MVDSQFKNGRSTGAWPPVNLAKWPLLILLVVVASGCGAKSQNNSGSATDPSSVVRAPDSYHFLKSDSLNADAIEEARAALPYDEIQLERTRCYGNCPSYIVTFKRDGGATFVGREHVQNIGKFSGGISVFDFGKLCWAIEKFNLTQLKPNRFVSGTVDQPTTVLRVKSRQAGTRIEIVEDGLPGPIELWVVQNSIDKLVSDIQWKASMDSLIAKPDAGALIKDAAKITLHTPNSSTLRERIRVDVAEPAIRARFMNAINKLAVKDGGLAMHEAADMPKSDVEISIQDQSGFSHLIGLYWGQGDGGKIVYEGRVYQVSKGLTVLRKLIAGSSGLPEFGGLKKPQG